MLPRERFADVIDATPLVSIDLIVRNDSGQVLLGYRVNRPAQNFWFVPGGRVRKNELLGVAFKRLTLTELGLEISREDAKFVGVYQHLYQDNALDLEGVSTHYVVLAYEVCLEVGADADDVNLEAQHSQQRWWHQSELLASNVVHANTKAYFDAAYRSD